MANMSSPLFTENNSSSSSPNSTVQSTSIEKLALSIFVSVVSFTGTIGNLLVIICILSQDINTSVTGNPTNLLLFSLAVADLLVSCVSGPALICRLYELPKAYFVSRLLGQFTGAASVGSLALLTLNRFLSIRYSLRYPRIVTPRRTKAAMALNWIISLVLSILVAVELKINVIQIDINVFYKLYIALAFVIIPSCYMYMYKKAKNHRKEIKRVTYRPTGHQAVLEKDLKSVFSLLLVSGTFFITWAPFMTFLIIKDVVKISRRIVFFLLSVKYLNSTLDPVIYYFRSAKFRQYLRRFQRRYKEQRIARHQLNWKHPVAIKKQKEHR